MNNTYDNSAASKLMGFAESMNSHLRAAKLNVTEFGRSAIMNPSRDTVRGLVKTFSNKVFAGEKVAAGENAGAGTNDALRAKVKLDFANKLEREYIARAEHVLLDTQTSGGVLSNITTHQQLYMVALVQGVIQPTYNKIFDTVVDPSPVFIRQINVPEFIDHTNKAHILADVINDNEKILALTSTANATLDFSLDFTAKTDYTEIKANIIDAFQAASGSGPNIASPRNFMNRGFKLVSIVYNDSGKKTIPVNWTSSENHTQSGEISDNVGAVTCTLKAAAPGGTDIEIYGKVTANGDVKLICNDLKVESIKISFNLPPVGIQNPFTTRDRIGKFQEALKENAKAQCTLNEMFLDDHNFYLQKDAIELFTSRVITLTNAKKDAYCLKQVDELISELNVAETPAFTNEENYFNSVFRSRFFGDTLDMNAVDAGLIDATNANNLMLAQRLYKLLNKMDVFMNPQEKNFTLYSDSAFAQWLKDAYGNTVSKFNIVGNANEIAGISTPYDIIRTTIGDFYSANYIATNRLKPKTETINGPLGKVPTGKKADIDVSDLYAIPNFEDDKDTLVFVSGKEYLTEGTGTAEDPASPSLNYQHRFDLMKMNRVIGKMTFKELPTSFY